MDDISASGESVLSLRLARSGPPCPESPAGLGQAGAGWAAWQVARGEESRALPNPQAHGELHSRVLARLILDQS